MPGVSLNTLHTFASEPHNNYRQVLFPFLIYGEASWGFRIVK